MVGGMVPLGASGKDLAVTHPQLYYGLFELLQGLGLLLAIAAVYPAKEPRPLRFVRVPGGTEYKVTLAVAAA